MADYLRTARQFPAVRDYLRHRRWIKRGDVTAYAPHIETSAFSTDAFGFRHTVFGGRRYGLGDAPTLPRYALVLGSSHVFGFGLAGNEETMGSQLSERLGYPCLTVCFPEADSRTLHAALMRILTQIANRPRRIFLFNGGDLTRFAYSGQADPLFGSPDFQRGVPPAGETGVEPLIQFTTFWVRQTYDAVTAAGIGFELADEPTFFEKPSPDAIEADCALGVATPANASRFALHKRFVWQFHEARRIARRALGREAWSAIYPDCQYIDEFHYRASTIRRFGALLLPD
jgi:hypothetical protein